MPAVNQPEHPQQKDSLPQDALRPPDLAIDITAHLCPMTFVRTRLALDRLRPDQILAVRLCGDEPRTNVPASVRELGHEVIALHEQPDGSAILIIRKRSAERRTIPVKAVPA